MVAHDADLRTGEGPGIFGTSTHLSRGTCVVGGQGNANAFKAQRAVNGLQPGGIPLSAPSAGIGPAWGLPDA